MKFALSFSPSEPAVLLALFSTNSFSSSSQNERFVKLKFAENAKINENAIKKHAKTFLITHPTKLQIVLKI